MADNEELFKTTAFGGYDKDDVQQELQKLKDVAYEDRKKLLKQLADATKALGEKDAEIADKDRKIAELQSSLNAKDREILDLEKNIKEKYQSYVDNYETIGSLIYEAKIRAKQVERETEAEKNRILADAQADAQRIRDDAQNDAQKTLDEVQRQIDEKNKTGKQTYDAVQEELGHVVEIFNQVQKQFMNSYRDIQRIINDAPPTDSGRNLLIDEDED